MTDEALVNHLLIGLFVGACIGLSLVLCVITGVLQVALITVGEVASVVKSLIPASVKSWSVIFLSTIGILTLIS